MAGGDRPEGRRELPVLRGLRVTLRPATPADAPDVERVLRAAEVARWWPIEGPEEVLALCDGSDPDVDVWVIVVDGGVGGDSLGWVAPDPHYRPGGIDLALQPWVHRRGLGPESIRLLARHLFRDRGHHRITIDPNRANERAIRAYASVGFQPVGVTRRSEWDAHLGRWTDGLLMDLLADELMEEPATPEATGLTRCE
jgi:aminoglycoside 6'-N-acetyltransferase